MTVTTVAIVCDITLADNTEFPSAQIRFTPSQAMIDAPGNDVIPPHPIIVDLNASGVGTANLWPVSAGSVHTHYAVEVMVMADESCGLKPFIYPLGIITPPATGGPFNLADLLAQTASGITIGSVTYATLSEAVAAAVSGAAIATEAANTATSAAAIAGASIYATTAAGIAATESGGYFYVPAEGQFIAYLQNAGDAVEVARIGQPVFADRAGLVAAVAAGYAPPSGTTVSAGGLSYARSEGATALPGLPGWLPFGPRVAGHAGFDDLVTVGTGGDFPTINAALDATFAQMTAANKTLEIRLLSGFVMAEQVRIFARDCAYATITADDAVVIIDRQALIDLPIGKPTSTFFPAFSVVRGRLPAIGALFEMNETGAAGGRMGVYVYDGSMAVILSGCGVNNAGGPGMWTGNSLVYGQGCQFNNSGGDGVYALHGSSINLRAGSFSGNASSGIHAADQSMVAADQAVANDNGANGVWSEACCNINFQRGEAKNSGVHSIRADSGSTVSSRDSDLSGAGSDCIHSQRGSLVTAERANVSNAGRNAIRAWNGGRVNADYAVGTGAGSDAVRGYRGAIINANNGEFSEAGGRGLYVSAGCTANVNDADFSGAGGLYGIDCVEGSTVNANSANAQKGASPSEDDVRVSGGGIVYANGATGGFSQSPNSFLSSGAILTSGDPSYSPSQTLLGDNGGLSSQLAPTADGWRYVGSITQWRMRRTNGAPLQLHRVSNGDIVEFRQDGTLVGAARVNDGFVQYCVNVGRNYSGQPVTTALRPTDVPNGFHVFDTTLGIPVWWDGTNWVDATGATV